MSHESTLLMKSPLITVITAVYNGASYIEETINSILQQTISDFEYIIIDDASTDNSIELIEKFHDPRIKLIKNSINLRLVATRNIGLAKARGKYIALIDHDDVAFPNRFEEQFQIMNCDPDLVMVASYAEEIGSHGNFNKVRGKFSGSSAELKARLIFRNPFVNSTIFFKNFFAEEFRYEYEFPLSEDYDFITRISKKGSLYLIPRALLAYRVHSNNYSHSKNNEMIKLGLEIKQRILQGFGLSPSKNDLEIHSYFEHQLKYAGTDILEKLERWVICLRTIEGKLSSHDAKDFSSVLNNEVSMLLEKLTFLGWRLVPYCIKSPFLFALVSNPVIAMRVTLKIIFLSMRQK